MKMLKDKGFNFNVIQQCIMNQKNSIGINKCFGETNNPIELFKSWFDEAKKTEINDPNAVALATADNKGLPSVRMVLLKDFKNLQQNWNTKSCNPICADTCGR